MYSMSQSDSRKIGYLVSGAAMICMAFLFKPSGIMFYAVLGLLVTGLIQVGIGSVTIIRKIRGSDIELSV